MVGFIVVNEAAWKLKLMSKAFRVMAQHQNGDNAIYKMADILQDVRALNNNGDTESTAIRGLVRMLDPKYNPEWQEARFLDVVR